MKLAHRDTLKTSMKTIQQNDFDHERVLLLKNNASASNTILGYLTLRNQRLNASGQKGSGGDNEGQSGYGDPGGGNPTRNDNRKETPNGAQKGDKKEENGQP